MELLRQILSILFVFGLLGAAWVWLRRRNGLRPLGGRRVSARLSSVERLALSPHHAVHLVRLGDRCLVVAVHAGGCTLLDSLPWDLVERLPAGSPPAPGLQEVQR